MHPIVLSLLLGLTAAAANVFGGAIIVQKNWDRSYLKYFVALGAGFMLATAIVEIFPASLELRGESAPILVLAGYFLVHLFEHTVTPHFHFGEETHKDAFVHGHRGYSVLMGLVIHTFLTALRSLPVLLFPIGWGGSSFWRSSCTRFRRDSRLHRSCWPAGKAGVWPGGHRCCSVPQPWPEC